MTRAHSHRHSMSQRTRAGKGPYEPQPRWTRTKQEHALASTPASPRAERRERVRVTTPHLTPRSIAAKPRLRAEVRQKPGLRSHPEAQPAGPADGGGVREQGERVAHVPMTLPHVKHRTGIIMLKRGHGRHRARRASPRPTHVRGVPEGRPPRRRDQESAGANVERGASPEEERRGKRWRRRRTRWRRRRHEPPWTRHTCVLCRGSVFAPFANVPSTYVQSRHRVLLLGTSLLPSIKSTWLKFDLAASPPRAQDRWQVQVVWRTSMSCTRRTPAAAHEGPRPPLPSAAACAKLGWCALAKWGRACPSSLLVCVRRAAQTATNVQSRL